MKFNWTENDVYGHKAILRQYARVGMWRRSIAGLQHGWTPTIHDYLIERSSSRFKRSFVWNRRDIRRHEQLGGKAESVGAPFLYLVHLFNLYGYRIFEKCEKPSTSERRSANTLVYCPHNWVGEPDSEDVLAFIRSLIDSRPGAYTFVIHSFDFANERIQSEIRDLEINVISHSSSTLDPCGSHRQLRALLDVHEVLCGYMGTPLIFAAYLGKRCQLVDQFNRNPGPTSPEFHFVDEDEILNLEAIFRDGIEGEGAKKIGEYELGYEYFRSPKEIRSLFGWSLGSQSLIIGYKILGKIRNHVWRRPVRNQAHTTLS